MGMQDGNVPKQICIHKTSKKDYTTNEDWTVETLRDYHMNVRGFSDIAYHFMIDKEGTIHTCRDIKYWPASCKGHNKDVCAIALIGDFFQEQPTDEQMTSLKILVLKLCKEYKIDTTMHHIFGHADYRDPPGNRYCPGKHLHRRIPEVATWVRNAIKRGIN